MVFGKTDKSPGEIPISPQMRFNCGDVAIHRPVVKRFVIGKVKTQVLKLPFHFPKDFCDEEEIRRFLFYLCNCFIPKLVLHLSGEFSPGATEYIFKHCYGGIATDAITPLRDGAKLSYHRLLQIGA